MGWGIPNFWPAPEPTPEPEPTPSSNGKRYNSGGQEVDALGVPIGGPAPPAWDGTLPSWFTRPANPNGVGSPPPPAAAPPTGDGTEPAMSDAELNIILQRMKDDAARLRQSMAGQNAWSIADANNRSAASNARLASDTSRYGVDQQMINNREGRTWEGQQHDLDRALTREQMAQNAMLSREQMAQQAAITAAGLAMQREQQNKTLAFQTWAQEMSFNTQRANVRNTPMGRVG